jgi:hypothetical protein
MQRGACTHRGVAQLGRFAFEALDAALQHQLTVRRAPHDTAPHPERGQLGQLFVALVPPGGELLAEGLR